MDSYQQFVLQAQRNVSARLLASSMLLHTPMCHTFICLFHALFVIPQQAAASGGGMVGTGITPVTANNQSGPFQVVPGGVQATSSVSPGETAPSVSNKVSRLILVQLPVIEANSANNSLCADWNFRFVLYIRAIKSVVTELFRLEAGFRQLGLQTF